MTSLAKQPRAEQWADRICAQLGKSVEAIIETGRLLVKAKTDLVHGEWGRLFADNLLPFSQQTANKFMAISENQLLSNPAHGRNLPATWTTLYELTKAEPTTLKNALRDGVITPDMPRSAVAELLAPKPAARVAVVDVEPDDTDTDDSDAVELAVSAPTKLGPPRNGLQFARIAIMKLEEIRDEDLERKHAFTMVRSWLDARET